MLGDSDDLAAVLAVLDRLEGELGKNRDALDLTCERADEIGEGASLPSSITGEDSIEDFERKIAQERKDCRFLRDAIDNAMEIAANSIKLLREINKLQAERELQVHKESSEELLKWQNQVETSSDEYSEMVFAHISTGAKLTQLYELLRINST